MKFKYYLAKVISKICRNNEIMNRYYRRLGVKIGKSCLICTDISGRAESFLVEIGDNTTISVNVRFITHDYSIHNLDPKLINLFGRIIIGNNCFIGANSILMYGVTVADNVIVAAGSVVTKSICKSNVIVGGNPARIIGTWDSFYDKAKDKSLSRYHLKEAIAEHPEKLIIR